MAHHKSTKKRIKTNLKANLHHRHYRSLMRTAIRRIGESQDDQLRSTNLLHACAVVDRLASKGIIHRNAAARTKSRLNRKFAQATA